MFGSSSAWEFDLLCIYFISKMVGVLSSFSWVQMWFRRPTVVQKGQWLGQTLPGDLQAVPCPIRVHSNVQLFSPPTPVLEHWLLKAQPQYYLCNASNFSLLESFDSRMSLFPSKLYFPEKSMSDYFVLSFNLKFIKS